MFKPAFATIEQSLVVRKMGNLSSGDVRVLRETMAAALG
jgi:hypothetical protein